MKGLIEQFAHNNFLITTSDWFVAPDGRFYKAVWGRVKIYSDQETLGIKTNNQSTNWYAIIGEVGKSVIVAGCQIKYACVSMEKPNTQRFEELRVSDQTAGTFKATIDNRIYLAQ